MQDNLKPGKLDIVALAQNKIRAEETIDVFTNEQAMRELAKVNTELTAIAASNRQDIPRYTELEAQAAKLTEELNSTKLTLHLQGLTQPEVEEVDAAAEAAGTPPDVHLVFRGLQKIVDAQGNETTEITLEDMEPLRTLLNSEWFDVISLMHELTFTQAYFTQAVDAGFLQRR